MDKLKLYPAYDSNMKRMMSDSQEPLFMRDGCLVTERLARDPKYRLKSRINEWEHSFEEAPPINGHMLDLCLYPAYNSNGERFKNDKGEPLFWRGGCLLIREDAEDPTLKLKILSTAVAHVVRN